MNYLLIYSESKIAFYKPSEDLQYIELDNKFKISKDNNVLHSINNPFKDIYDFKKILRLKNLI